MRKKWVIIGGGIAGTTLALQCLRNDIPVELYHVPLSGEASGLSSGLINPITGRRYVKSWMIDDFLSAAGSFYIWSENWVGKQFYFPVEITRFITNDEALNAWNKRLDDPEYNQFILASPHDNDEYSEVPYGIVGGCWRLDVRGWMEAMHNKLYKEGVLRLAYYKDENSNHETHIVHTKGALDKHEIPGMIPNKGENLICWMPDWTMPGISKQYVYVIPIAPQTYWIGSFYDPWPKDPYPTESGRNTILNTLRTFYKGRLEIISHNAGVRPTVEDRRPIMGEHPRIKGEHIFTGLGTKGTSLAPYWSLKLIQSLDRGENLPKEVLAERFL